METSVIMAFAALSLALIAVPGPDWAYIIAAGVRGRVVGPAVGGLMLGYVVITVVVVLGLGPIAANAPILLVALTIGGAGYLIYLGVKTLRSTAQVETGTVAAVPTGGSWGYILRGAAVSGLNPKGVLFFLSILPQFVRTSSTWPLSVQLAVLGVVWIVIGGIFYALLGSAFGRVIGTRPRFADITTRVAGVAMLLLGVVMLGEKALEIAHSGGMLA